MKTRNDHGEKCFIQNKYTPNAKLTIVWTDKTTLKKFSLYFETRELDTLYREAALSQTRSWNREAMPVNEINCVSGFNISAEKLDSLSLTILFWPLQCDWKQKKNLTQNLFKD